MQFNPVPSHAHDLYPLSIEGVRCRLIGGLDMNPRYHPVSGELVMAGDARPAHEKRVAGVREHQGRDGRERGTLGAARGKVTTRRGSRQGHSRRGGRQDVSRRGRDGSRIGRDSSMVVACHTLLGPRQRRRRAQWLEGRQQGRRTLHACHGSSRATPRGRRLHDALGRGGSKHPTRCSGALNRVLEGTDLFN